MESKEQTTFGDFFRIIKIPLAFVTFIWLIHIAQVLTHGDWGYYGIFPRETFGLRGILLSPLLHSDFGHLFSNSVPLFVASSMILYFYPRVAVQSLLMIYFLTGAAVWLMARPVYHVGASGVVYGLVAFIAWSGIFRRNPKAVILGLIVTVLYGGMLAGVLPNQEGISWESHLLGGLSGIFTAYFYKEVIEQDELKKNPFADEVPRHERPFFLPSGTFEKTKEERRIEAELLRQAEERRRLEQEGYQNGWFSTPS